MEFLGAVIPARAKDIVWIVYIFMCSGWTCVVLNQSCLTWNCTGKEEIKAGIKDVDVSIIAPSLISENLFPCNLDTTESKVRPTFWHTLMLGAMVRLWFWSYQYFVE